jgi:hypothetical protein
MPNCFQQTLPVHTLNEDWVRDFTTHTRVFHHPPSPVPSPFEDIYRINSQCNWKDEFSTFHQQASSSEVSEEEHLAFEHAFEELDEGKVEMFIVSSSAVFIICCF